MNRRLFILFFFASCWINGFAQQRSDSTKFIKDSVRLTPESDQYFTSVLVDADFPGGTEAWSRFLAENLNQNTAINHRAKAGKYTVKVMFTIDLEGAITNITILNDPGFGTAEEVIRVLNKSPKWKPAIQNGRLVKAYRSQSISFQVVEAKGCFF